LLAERLRRWMASRAEPTVHASRARAIRRRARALYEALPPMERYLASAFDNVASAVRRSTWERHPFPARSFGRTWPGRGRSCSTGHPGLRALGRGRAQPRIDMLREARRIYCDHRNLLELFGLRNVPTWGAYGGAGQCSARFYARAPRRARIAALAAAALAAYSVALCLVRDAAQFLGARSHWKTVESPFWAWATPASGGESDARGAASPPGFGYASSAFCP
jgi:hypothetical protein